MSYLRDIDGIVDRVRFGVATLFRFGEASLVPAAHCGNSINNSRRFVPCPKLGVRVFFTMAEALQVIVYARATKVAEWVSKFLTGNSDRGRLLDIEALVRTSFYLRVTHALIVYNLFFFAKTARIC